MSASGPAAPASLPQHEVTDKFISATPEDFEEWLLERSKELVRLARLIHVFFTKATELGSTPMIEILLATQLLAYCKALRNVHRISRVFKDRITTPNTTAAGPAISQPGPCEAMKTIIQATCISFPQGHINKVSLLLCRKTVRFWLLQVDIRTNTFLCSKSTGHKFLTKISSLAHHTTVRTLSVMRSTCKEYPVTLSCIQALGYASATESFIVWSSCDCPMVITFICRVSRKQVYRDGEKV